MNLKFRPEPNTKQRRRLTWECLQAVCCLKRTQQSRAPGSYVVSNEVKWKLKSCNHVLPLPLLALRPSAAPSISLLVCCKSFTMTKQHLQGTSYLKSSHLLDSANSFLPLTPCWIFSEGKAMTILMYFMPFRKWLKKKLVCFVGCFKKRTVIFYSSLFTVSLSNISIMKSRSSCFFQGNNTKSRHFKN